MKKTTPWDRWISLLLLIVFGAIYGVTFTRGPHPGISSSLILQQLGLDPFVSPLYPIWGLLVGLLARLAPAAALSTTLNLFTALLSAVSVALLYAVVSRLPGLHIQRSDDHPASPVPGRIAGVAAAVAFGFSMPGWSHATFLHHAPFEVVLFLTASLLFVVFSQKGDMRYLNAFAILYGFGVAESVLFIIAAPLFAGYAVVLLALADRLTLKAIGRLAGLALPGLLLYLVGAWRLYSSPAMQWYDYSSFGYVIWVFWRDQYSVIMHGMGQAGWLLVFLTTMLPFLIVLFTPKLLTSYQSRKIGPLALYFMMTLLAGTILFNTTLAPWTMLGATYTILFPYLLWAVTLGYLVGYWYIVLSGRYFSRRTSNLLRKVRPVWLVLVVGGLLAAAALNAQALQRQDPKPMQDFADLLLDGMNGREWLVSNGIFDSVLQVRALERQQPLRLINVRVARNPIYLRFLADQFEDLRLQSLALLGVVPLLQEWLAEEEEITSKLAALTWDELWSGAGFYPVPEAVLFGGIRNTDELDLDRLSALHENVWASFGAQADRFREDDELGKWMVSHVARLANNFGVLLEELQQPEQGYAAYLAARRFYPENISALLNATFLAERNAYAELEELSAGVKALEDLPAQELRHWSLVARYGIVRHPEGYARRGLAWAMSGKADVAIADIQRAIQAGAQEENLGFMLASLYFADEQFDESERIYARLLETDPDQPNALMGMAQIATRRGHYDLARGYLERLRTLGVDPGRVLLEEALLDVLSGNQRDGRRKLEALVKDHPGLTLAWATLVMMALADQDEALLDQSLKALGDIGDLDLRSLMIIAHAQMSRRQFAEARQTLERAARQNPTHVPLHEQLLRIEVLEGDQASARRRVELILSLDSRNAIANYILGSLHYAEGNRMLAESAFRSSIRRQPSAEGLNDLAWVLQERGELDESLKFVRQALELNPNNPVVWSTLGTILRQRGDTSEAERSFRRALELNRDDPRIRLNTAELLAEIDQRPEARELLEPVLELISLLPEADQRRATALSARLRR